MTAWQLAILVVGSFCGGAGAWALLTRLAYGLPAEDDGGPEGDRLIAEAMAAWRADVAGRIAGRLAAHGRLVEGQARAAEGDILVELERSGLDA